MINLTTTDPDGEEFAGRFTSKAELDADGRACDMPPAQDGIVELLDEDGDTIADEWVPTVEAAQAWLDDFDFDEYRRELAENDVPDFEYDGETGRYYRC